MDRALILEHLAKAEEHVAKGEEHVRRQRELVAELARDGHDTGTARAVLGTFEELLAAHVADRERITKELAASKKLSPVWGTGEPP